MSTSPASGAAPVPGAARPVEPLHGCVRCGARIPVSQSMCDRCNPLGLKAPAASQAHGIAFVGIGLAVVLLAFLARIGSASVGPFPSALAGIVVDPAGLKVTISVTNQGSNAASTTCRVLDPALPGLGPETAFVQTPIIQPGSTSTFDTIVTTLGSTPRQLAVDCGQ